MKIPYRVSRWGEVGKNNQQENSGMKGLYYYPSAIILKVNGFNTPIKRHRLVDWVKKDNSYAIYKKYI